MLDTLDEKLSPKIIALLVFPMLLVVSLPFAFITGVVGIIITDTVAVGWGVGIVMGLILATWATIGSYRLATEAENEPGADSVSA